VLLHCWYCTLCLLLMLLFCLLGTLADRVIYFACVDFVKAHVRRETLLPSLLPPLSDERQELLQKSFDRKLPWTDMETQYYDAVSYFHSLTSIRDDTRRVSRVRLPPAFGADHQICTKIMRNYRMPSLRMHSSIGLY